MRSDTKWFKDAGWGVFYHYLAMGVDGTGREGVTVDEWNRHVDSFNVKALAQQLESIGAKYIFITIGQNSGYYCSPNKTYDNIVGIKPSKCSKRDLISDLSDTLKGKGIKLLVYLPNNAPCDDTVAVARLGWRWGWKKPGWWGNNELTGERLAEFQVKWEAVIREWSLRWGKKVSGWWIDGCYFADQMYRHPEPPNFQSFAAALKAGNPDAIIAFNPGVKTPVISLTEFEDYTAGEISEEFPVCPGRLVDGAQYHILSYLGKIWGQGDPRFEDEFIIGYTKDLITKGGVVSWDVPHTYEGLIRQPFLNQLKKLNSIGGTT